MPGPVLVLYTHYWLFHILCVVVVILMRSGINKPISPQQSLTYSSPHPSMADTIIPDLKVKELREIDDVFS